MEPNSNKQPIASNTYFESNSHLSEGYSRSKNEEEKINIHL